MKFYRILGKVIMVTSLITIPLVFLMPILLIFKIRITLVGLVFLLSSFLYVFGSYYRDKYTTEHLKINICPNCKSHELSFSKKGSSGNMYDTWECRKCSFGWEHTRPGNYGYNRYVRKENELYKRV